jgi:N-methylhydantoinase A
MAEADFSMTGLTAIAEGFHLVHRQRFSYEDRTVPVEIVSLRLTARGLLAKPSAAETIPPEGATPPGTRPLLIDGTWQNAAILRREAVSAAPLCGPAVIEEAYTSTYLPPGWTAASHPGGAIIARRARPDAE